MTPVELREWRNEVLSRLEVLKAHTKQTLQLMKSRDLQKLDENGKAELEEEWERIEHLFPSDFHAARQNDLSRHLHFAYQHDFDDIENLDIPAVTKSVKEYGRSGDNFVAEEMDRVRLQSSVSDIIHALIRDACADFVAARQHSEAARAAVGLLMDELRRLSGEESDGDTLIRGVVGVNHGQIAFSNCHSKNAKQVTQGFKQMTQGLYKGVRNPISHGWREIGEIEAFQIMTCCSLLLTQLQLVESVDGS